MRQEKLDKNQAFFGSAFLVGAGTFLSRILGLVREQVFAYFFGAGMATDAFQIAFRIPNLLRDLFAEGAMSSSLVPVYLKLRHDKGDQEAWKLVSNVVSTLGLVLSSLTLVGILFSGPLVHFYAPTFAGIPGKQELAASLTQILWPFLPMVVFAAVWMGVLNARDKYKAPALAPSIFNVISIASAFLICPMVSKIWGLHPIYGMAIGATFGGLGQWLIQVPALYREGYRFSFFINLKDPALNKMILLMGAGTFGLAATQINIFVNSVLASSQGNGAISWLNYAFRLMQFPIGVFGVAISTVTLTRVSKEAANNDFVSIRKSVQESMGMVFALTIPSAFGLALFGFPIISVIYEHGRFTIEDSYSTAMALAAYSLGLSAYSGIKVLVPILYSLNKAKAAIFSSGLSVILNLCLGIPLVHAWGFKGLPVSTSCSSLVSFLVLFFLVNKYVQNLPWKKISSSLIKSVISSVIMSLWLVFVLNVAGIPVFRPIALTSWWVKATFFSHLCFLMGSLVVAVVIYAFAAKKMGLNEIDRITNILWKRLRRNNRELK